MPLAHEHDSFTGARPPCDVGERGSCVPAIRLECRAPEINDRLVVGLGIDGQRSDVPPLPVTARTYRPDVVDREVA